MILTGLYWCIVLFLLILVGWNFWEEKSFTGQLNALIIIIPLLLRLLLIK